MGAAPTMVASHVVNAILQEMPDNAAVICANGYISREAFGINDRSGNFYMIGSMGLGASIALGAALANPDQPVVILDGDGNILMGMGTLAVIGALKPKNLFHVCIDNGVYASTGNQPTVSRTASLEGIAREAGYVRSYYVDTVGEEQELAKAIFAEPGPVFARFMVEPEGHPKEFARVSHTPEEIRDRFSDFLQKAN